MPAPGAEDDPFMLTLRGKSITRGAGCVNRACPDMWEPWEGNDPGSPGRVARLVGEKVYENLGRDPRRLSENSGCEKKAAMKSGNQANDSAHYSQPDD